jgi:hypothetical protein
VPLLIALALIFAAFSFAAALVPFALVFRYYHGARRRRFRAWLATLNVFSLTLSVLFFLVTAAVTNRWVPDAFSYTTLGLASGASLALAGLALTRWDRAGGDLFYTPNRILVLTISIVVAARIAYGFWRGWHSWRASEGNEPLLASIGLPASMAAGAMVLGYYLVYWLGLRSAARSTPRLRSR